MECQNRLGGAELCRGAKCRTNTMAVFCHCHVSVLTLLFQGCTTSAYPEESVFFLFLSIITITWAECDQYFQPIVLQQIFSALSRFFLFAFWIKASLNTHASTSCDLAVRFTWTFANLFTSPLKHLPSILGSYSTVFHTRQCLSSWKECLLSLQESSWGD